MKNINILCCIINCIGKLYQSPIIDDKICKKREKTNEKWIALIVDLGLLVLSYRFQTWHDDLSNNKMRS